MLLDKDKLLKTFIELVKIDSESKNEIQVAEYIKKRLKKLNIPFVIDNSKNKTGSNHGNIIAKLNNNR